MHDISAEYGLQILLQRTKEMGLLALQIQPTVLLLGSKHGSRQIKKFMFWNSACRLSVLEMGNNIMCAKASNSLFYDLPTMLCAE
jgi:hypothetical protein